MKVHIPNHFIIKENTMKVSEILEKMDGFTGKERKKYLGGIFKKVSPISNATLKQFENEWDGSKTFEEFKVAQNKVVRECIQMEIMINDVKEKENMEVFTMDTEIV